MHDPHKTPKGRNGEHQSRGFLLEQQQDGGQGVPALLYRFPQNTSFLIFVYLLFTSAGALAIWPERHSRAPVTRDVSEMLVRRQRGENLTDSCLEVARGVNRFARLF